MSQAVNATEARSLLGVSQARYVLNVNKARYFSPEEDRMFCPLFDQEMPVQRKNNGKVDAMALAKVLAAARLASRG